MSIKIRLTRMGSKHRPFYRLVVADSRIRRDGRVTENLGYYNPIASKAEICVNTESALNWLKKGAQPTETARSLLKKVGVWQFFRFVKEGKSEAEARAMVDQIMAAGQDFTLIPFGTSSAKMSGVENAQPAAVAPVVAESTAAVAETPAAPEQTPAPVAEAVAEPVAEQKEEVVSTPPPAAE